MALNLTGYYDGSFKGVSFWEQFEGGWSAAGADYLEDTVKIRIPGGDRTVIQRFGVQTRTFDLPVSMNAADVSALSAKRGQTGSLVFHNGTITAFFDGIVGPRLTGDSLGVFNLTLRFTI